MTALGKGHISDPGNRLHQFEGAGRVLKKMRTHAADQGRKGRKTGAPDWREARSCSSLNGDHVVSMDEKIGEGKRKYLKVLVQDREERA